MVTVTLTINNSDKAEKLRGLLQELPFVDIQYWAETISPDLTNWLSIYARYQQAKHLGWGHVTGGNFPVWLFNGVSKSIYEKFGRETLGKVFTSLATDPQLFEAEQLVLNDAKAYLVTVHGFRVLYELSPNDPSLHIGYIDLA